MNNRQRFNLTLNKGVPDRVPLFSEGIRNDIIRRWRSQGLGYHSLSEMIELDPYELTGPELDPIPYPKYWPEKPADLKKLAKALDPKDRRRYPLGWIIKYKSLHTRDIVTFLCLHQGFFLSMGVDGWDRFETVINLLNSNPMLIHDQMDIFSDFTQRITENILDRCTVDAVYFSEPIGGNDRPLISPKMYQNFVLRSYFPIIDTIKKYNISNIVFQTYGNIWPLLGSILEAGFTCLWSCETNAPAMDYRHIRKIFGADLGLIGGINLDILRQGKKSIDQELEQKLPELLNQGNYIPLANGRVRADISFENYLYYRQKLSSMVKKG